MLVTRYSFETQSRYRHTISMHRRFAYAEFLCVVLLGSTTTCIWQVQCKYALETNGLLASTFPPWQWGKSWAHAILVPVTQLYNGCASIVLHLAREHYAPFCCSGRKLYVSSLYIYTCLYRYIHSDNVDDRGATSRRPGRGDSFS